MILVGLQTLCKITNNLGDRNRGLFYLFQVTVLSFLSVGLRGTTSVNKMCSSHGASI